MTTRDDLRSELFESPERSALVMDFDGVLAPIVDDPTQSRMLDGSVEVLTCLAQQLGLLAIISGRPAQFLLEHAEVPGAKLLGSYGLEQVHDGKPFPDPAAEIWLNTVAEATTELHRQLDGIPGVRVERKSLSVAVHWRQAADSVAAEQLVDAAVSGVASGSGLDRKAGKLVEELLVPLDQDKGTALKGLVVGAGFNWIAYAGDDLGDLPAMRAAHALGGYALAVTHGKETPRELLEVADVTFDGVPAFAEWLAEMASHCEVGR